MKLRPVLPLAVLAVSLLSAQEPPGAGACPDTELSMHRTAGEPLVVKWHAAAGTTQLYRAGSLGDTATWTPVPGATPTPDGFWQVEVLPDEVRAFFKIEPAVTPLPPPNVRLIMTGDHFRLEWDSSCDASGYVVYVGLSPDTGPANHLQSLPLPLANALEITGLTAGQTYYITIAAKNVAGEGAPAPVLSGVYGPKGLFSGRAVWSFPRTGCTDCEAFMVEAEGAEIQLMSFALPGGAPFRATADVQGQFRIPQVPAGIYFIGWMANGQAGFLPEPVEMTTDGVTKSPLVLPSGPLPPPPATTLLGTLTLSTGGAPRIDLPEFGLHARAELRADFADGSSRTVIPDRRGAWALPEITGGFPITLTATYQGLVKVTQVAAPPLELTPLTVQFAEPIPKVHRLTAWQNGAEVMEIAAGVPVTFQAEVANPAGLPAMPRWIAEYNGQKRLSTGASPDFTFDSGHVEPGEPDVGGTVRVRCFPSPFTAVDADPFNFVISGEPVSVRGFGSWSGMAGTWNPATPLDIGPAHPAEIKVTHTGVANPSLTSTIVTQNGRSYFELPLDPVSVPPYLVRVDKTNHMRFLWPFEHQLPKEATFCVVPATITSHTQSPGVLMVNHPSGATLFIPYGGLVVPSNNNVQWYGNIIVKMVSWSTDFGSSPSVWTVLPPNPELRAPGLRNGIESEHCVWFEITTDNGVPLTPLPTATLTLPGPAWFDGSDIPCYHQVESTGYFERQGFPSGKAVKVGLHKYNVSLGTSGLFMVGYDDPLLDILFEADRTLNYPFEVIVNRSIFPVTVTGPCQNSFGHLYMRGAGHTSFVQVLDERQAPGLHYMNPAQASFFPPVSPQRKRVITYKYVNTSVPSATLPAIAPAWARLTLGDSEFNLRTNPTDTTVTGIDGPNHFLSRMTSTPQDAAAYYQKIQAPATLAQWRALNGFPATFGGTISGTGMDGYATCYYYNLGDLGFARAQTMRVTTSSGADGQPDVAFAVTNYPTLEDARCKRGAIATVCMDYAKRADSGQATPSRYTRFYVYGPGGALQDCADLDGSGGTKCVPNLCVVCHGGIPYTAGGPTNLGSRFLPFDLDSYTFHPRYGVQKQEIANMNAAVLKTGGNSAINALIAGWYGNANPVASSAVWNNFNAAWMPPAFLSGWTLEPQIYHDVFKQSCRVCHISRDTGSTKQFETLTQLANPNGANYGYGSACLALSMPHSQRTWAIFWGSRCNINQNSLGNPGTQNMPTTLLSVLLNTYPNLKCRQ